MSRLLLWRHGLTAWNAEGRIQGQLDPPLAEEGVRQAEKAAEFLAALAPRLIVSSDLSRARLTAAELAARTGLPVALDERLRERHWGEWQGATHAELAVSDPERYAAWRDGGPVDVPGAESNAEVGVRVAAALIEHAPEDGVAVVVSHGGALKHGLARLISVPALGPVLRGLDNCRWSEVQRRGEGWVLGAHNVGA